MKKLICILLVLMAISGIITPQSNDQGELLPKTISSSTVVQNELFGTFVLPAVPLEDHECKLVSTITHPDGNISYEISWDYQCLLENPHLIDEEYSK